MVVMASEGEQAGGPAGVGSIGTAPAHPTKVFILCSPRSPASDIHPATPKSARTTRPDSFKRMFPALTESGKAACEQRRGPGHVKRHWHSLSLCIWCCE